MIKLLAAIVTVLGISTQVQAETLEYQAITDFPDINDGEVPYYIHQGVSALAINAGKPAYRNKFARATTEFDGTAGVYDVTISALGELDGECEFRFLVNGVVVGTAINARVSQDYGVQNHTIQDINIPAGAEISVESNAVSNGLVPENDIFAFARGRWTTLTLESDDTATAQSIDLDVTASVSDDTPEVGESITINVEIENNSATQTATNPILTLASDNISINTLSQCSINDGGLTCALAEIGPDQSRTVSFTGAATASGAATVSVSASADQQDSQSSNNNVTIEIDSTNPVISSAPTVDLAVTITSDVASTTVGDTISYTLKVTNQHQSNVATSPVAGILLPDGLSFKASSDCTATNGSVTCPLTELGSSESTTAQFTASANAPGNLTVVASVSAAESEVVVNDNEVLYSITAIDSNRSTTQNQTSTVSQKASTGGGYTSPLTLFGLGLIALLSRRRIRK